MGKSKHVGGFSGVQVEMMGTGMVGARDQDKVCSFKVQEICLVGMTR